MNAAAKLQAVVTSGGSTYTAAAVDALTYNRNVWQFVLDEVQDGQCPCSLEFKEGMTRISVFVLADTMALHANLPVRVEEFQSLIDINCSMATFFKE